VLCGKEGRIERRMGERCGIGEEWIGKRSTSQDLWTYMPALSTSTLWLALVGLSICPRSYRRIPFLEPQVLDRFFRKKVSRADRPIFLRFCRTSSTRAHKKLDVQEPGLHPGPGPGAEFAGRAACAPQKNIRAESVLFVFINLHPTPIVRCAAVYLRCPPPDGECRALRSVEVMVAAMDLSRLFQGQNTGHFTSRAS
jgi:hypothetical protein